MLVKKSALRPVWRSFSRKASESDPVAAPFKYKADATKAAERKDATALCSNCMHYSGKPGEASGPCALFQGKLVSANGWCIAWAKKAA